MERNTHFTLKHRATAIAAALSFSLALPVAAAATPPELLAAAGGGPVPFSTGPGGVPVAFDAAAAGSLPAGGEATVTLPRLGTLTVIGDRKVQHPNGDTTWSGHFKGHGTGYRLVVTTGQNGASGRIAAPGGEFSLTPEPGGGTLLVDQASLARVIQHEDDAVPATVPAAPAAAVAQMLPVSAAAVPATAATTTVAAAAPTGQATVDLMIAYSAGMVTRYGSGLQTRLNSLVAIANQAYVDSGVQITLRLVGTVEADYSDGATASAALSGIAAGNGAFANIQAQRTQYGADLVSFVRPFNYVSSGGLCGLGAEGLSVNGQGWYSVVEDGADTGGSGSVCQDVVLAHETGHNFGALHDRAHTIIPAGTGYQYGYGIPGVFADIMSVNYIDAPSVAKFSNPATTCDAAGDPCGIAPGSTLNGTPNSADSAQTLNDNRFAVAALMSAAASQPPGISLSATPPSIFPGGQATLSWSSSNATACSATSNAGQSFPSVPLSGAAAMAMAASASYTLTCAGAGGSNTATATITVSSPPAGLECLLNWAEGNYPGLFSPAGAKTQVSGVYAYRYYPGTNAYVGLSSADNTVNYMGADGVIHNEGALAGWLATAGCQ